MCHLRLLSTLLCWLLLASSLEAREPQERMLEHDRVALAGNRRASEGEAATLWGPDDVSSSEAACRPFTALFRGMQRAVAYWQARRINASTIEQAMASCHHDCVHIKVRGAR